MTNNKWDWFSRLLELANQPELTLVKMSRLDRNNHTGHPEAPLAAAKPYVDETPGPCLLLVLWTFGQGTLDTSGTGIKVPGVAEVWAPYAPAGTSRAYFAYDYDFASGTCRNFGRLQPRDGMTYIGVNRAFVKAAAGDGRAVSSGLLEEAWLPLTPPLPCE